MSVIKQGRRSFQNFRVGSVIFYEAGDKPSVKTSHGYEPVAEIFFVKFWKIGDKEKEEKEERREEGGRRRNNKREGSATEGECRKKRSQVHTRKITLDH